MVMSQALKKRRLSCVSPKICFDLQTEILTRLPSKSLMRFKSVSKLWCSLIKSRSFSNSYLITSSPSRQLQQQQPRLYMSLVDHNSTKFYNNLRESLLVSLSSSRLSFEKESALPGLGGRNMVILRGLILYTVFDKACIYNPATRQTVTLPAVKSNIFARQEYLKSVFYFFGHDPVLDKYKVVCTVSGFSSSRIRRINSEHWVFVLKEGGEGGSCWRKIKFGKPHFPAEIGFCVDGVIYYLADASTRVDIIVSFDVRSEEFKFVTGPTNVFSINLIKYRGKPAVLDHTRLRRNGLVDLWVLESLGTKEWSKETMVLKPCHMHLVNDKNVTLMVKGTTRHGEIILAPLSLISSYYILFYDPKKNDMRKVEINGIPEHWISKLDDSDTNLLFYFQFMDTESIMHL